MTRKWASAGPAGRPTALLLVVLMVLRALVPAGYMPNLASSEAGVGFVICHGSADATVPSASAAPPAADEKERPAAPQRQTACDFAVLAGAWLNAGTTAMVNPRRQECNVARCDVAAVLLQRSRAGGGGARAPPVMS